MVDLISIVYCLVTADGVFLHVIRVVLVTCLHVIRVAFLEFVLIRSFERSAAVVVFVLMWAIKVRRIAVTL